MRCPHCSEEVADVVPRDRINSKNAKIRELEAQLAEVTDKADGLDKLAKRAAEAESALEATRAEFDAFKSEASTSADLMRAGIVDADDQELVRWRYAKLGDGAPDFATWLSTGAKEDRHVARLFQTPAPVEAAVEAPTPAPEQVVAAAPPPAAPPSNAGAVPSQAAPPPRYSPQDVASMPLEALREAIAAGAFG